jgi:lipopolysaccharide transport system permease protein
MKACIHNDGAIEWIRRPCFRRTGFMMHFQNPHRAQPTSPYSLVQSIYGHRQLIFQMVRREVVGRYKGSVMGIAWSLLNPIFMLVIYTFVFSVVFKARWGEGASDSKTQFAILVFIGMIVQGLFTEAVNRAPGLITGNVNFVKKVIFPIEILPVISLGASLFHALISLLVLVAALIAVNGYLNWTIIFIPLVLLPLIIFILGFTWVLASLGVFMRDVGQTVGLLTTVLMFISPVFYPVSALPENFQKWMMLNPLAFIIEQARSVAIYGNAPDCQGLAVYTAIALMVLWLGYIWFQKTRKGFADVL